MVHGKILQTCGPSYKTLKTAILFPRSPEIPNSPPGFLSHE